MLNQDALLNYQIPPVRQTLSPRDAAFYALSCGMGADPMDQGQLDYVDFHRPLKVLPSMPAVLCYTRNLLTRPEFGIDAVKIVHGEEHVTLHAPLPATAKLIGQGKITQLIDKGEGRGAVAALTREIFDETANTHIATVTSTVFMRGDGGFGGTNHPTAAPPKTPDTPPDFTVELPTRPEQALYYRLNGDENPLHADPGFAARAGFPRPILHGLCTFGIVTHAILKTLASYNPAQIKSIGCRFSSPVFPGETITTDIWHNGAFRARVASRGAVVVNHGLAMVG